MIFPKLGREIILFQYHSGHLLGDGEGEYGMEMGSLTQAKTQGWSKRTWTGFGNVTYKTLCGAIPPDRLQWKFRRVLSKQIQNSNF